MTDKEFNLSVAVNNLIAALITTTNCSEEELWEYLRIEVGFSHDDYMNVIKDIEEHVGIPFIGNKNIKFIKAN